MKRVGLQEKSSFKVEGYVEYNGAVSARRSFHARKRSSLGRVPLSQSQQILRHDCTISITGFAIWSGMPPPPQER
jgi:hypothetical protein